MSDKESSSSDMECDDVTEGATVRVVQSSMHASIKQNSLFKVTENKKESDDEDNEVKSPVPKPEEKPENPPEEEKKEDPPKEEEKPEEKPEKKPEEPEAKIEVLANIEKPEEPPKVDKEIIKPEKKTYNKTITRILADEKPKKHEKIDVKKRFYDYQEKINKKIQDLKDAQEKDQQEQCTFAPKIKKTSETRRFEQFLKHVNNFDKAKKERIEKFKREKEEEMPKKSSFKPTLSEKTIELTRDLKPEDPIHVRLYKESEILKNKQELLVKETMSEIYTFHPKIEPVAGLTREGDTRTRLYELSKEKPKVEKTEKKQKLINDESESLVHRKLEKLMNEFLPKHPTLELNPDQESSEKPQSPPKPLQDSFNFSEFLDFLIKLGFIFRKTDSTVNQPDQDLAQKAWNSLGANDTSTIPIDQIKSFIFSILTPSCPKSQKQHLDFLQFYHNFHKPPPSSPQVQPSFSFKPTILSKSQKIAAIVNETRANNAANKKIENILYILHEKKMRKFEEKKKNLDSIISPECTFQPITTRGPRLVEEELKDNCSLSSDYLRILSDNKYSRHEALYSFSKCELERKEKISRTADDWEIERNMGECSFVPDLDKPKIDLKVGNEVKGLEKTLERMNRVREDKKVEAKLEPMKFGMNDYKGQKVK